MLMLPPSPMLDIDAVATRCGVTRDAVSGWIASKELPAVNVSRARNAKRATWRIRPEDLETFELSRRTSKPASTAKPKRPKPAAATRKWV